MRQRSSPDEAAMAEVQGTWRTTTQLKNNSHNLCAPEREQIIFLLLSLRGIQHDPHVQR